MMMHRYAASRLWKAIVLVSICGASSPGLAATFTVVNLADSGQGSLRQAVLDANASPGANTVTFSDGLTGTIVLTSGQMIITNDLTITGPGAALIGVDGNQQSRIFTIGNGATVVIAGLSLTNGLATGNPARGGAILNSGGNLSLMQVTVAGNRAVGTPGANGNGGGVFSLGGPLNVLNSAFIANEARGGVPGGSGFGGAVNNTGPRSTISGSTFLGNRAIGGDGGVVIGAQPFEVIGGGLGGAVRNAGVLTIENSLFDGNQAIGGNGGSAARTARDYDISYGYGGGLFNFSGTITVRGSTFRGNAAIGGSNATASYGRGHVGDGSGGGFINLDNGTATLSDCSFDHNEAQGGNGNVGGTSLKGGVGAFIVGWGQGGAITNEGWERGQGTTLTASRLTLTHNEAIGGAGNSGNLLAGAGVGGGINAWWIASSVTIVDSLFAYNRASANGANGQGGAMSAVIGAVIRVSGSLIEKNGALGGDSSDGAGGNGFGGGVYVDAASSVGVQTTTVSGNHANGGEGTTSDGVGIGGGVYSLGSFSVDDPASIRDNHASFSNDDIYP